MNSRLRYISYEIYQILDQMNILKNRYSHHEYLQSLIEFSNSHFIVIHQEILSGHCWSVSLSTFFQQTGYFWWWWGLNRGSPLSEATTLPTVSQPLARIIVSLIFWHSAFKWGWRVGIKCKLKYHRYQIRTIAGTWKRPHLAAYFILWKFMYCRTWLNL